MNWNHVTIGGRLTRDPELKFTASGMAVCEIGLAVNRKYKDKEETGFYDVTFFGKQAEAVNEYFSKGSGILIGGRLQQDRWDDKTTGQKRSKVIIIGEKFEFTDSKGDATGQQSKGQNDGGSSSTGQTGNGADVGGDDSSIPF